MEIYYKPTDVENNDFLLLLTFGEAISTDPLMACIKTAYLDLNRTIRGFAGLSNGAKICADAHSLIREQIRELRKEKSSQKEFDAWHKRSCEQLVSFYKEQLRSSPKVIFTVGQAQKWLNMAMKYIYIVGEQRIPGYVSFYDFCHMPMDNRILEHHETSGLYDGKCAWSKINKYDKYLLFQEKAREKFAPSPLLAVEFKFWMPVQLSLEKV
jgi:hypothetical protein